MSIYRTNNPTEFDDVDGIIVDETAPAPRITGVASNIAILLGQFQRGPATLNEVGSIGSFHEQYGKSDFSGNVQLKNKRFARLRCIRVVAADAALATKNFASSATDRIQFDAKQGKGAYGNNIQVKIGNATSDVAGVQQEQTITCVADVSDSLDGKYFILQDEDGSVAFWIDVDDSGTTIPAGAAAADRAVEITTIVTDMSADDVAAQVTAAVTGDSKFTANSAGAICTATNVTEYTLPALDAGDSGFTLAVTTAGVTPVEGGVTYTIRDANPNPVIADEVYRDIKIAEITAETFVGSKLVVATVLDSAAEPDTTGGFVNLAGGSDGTVGDTDYQTAMVEAEVEGAGNVLFLDEYNANRNGYLKVHADATRDKMVIVCGPESQTRAEAQSDVALYRDTDGRIIYAYPWLETTVGSVPTFVPPASFYASVISQTSPHIDPAFSGNSGFLSGITALKLTLTRADYILLKDAGVSAFELDQDIGFKIKSGVVTQIVNSSKVMVFRRRMADWLTDSAAKFLKNYQNAVNSQANRGLVKGSILDFVRQNEIAGVLPADAEVNTGLAKLVDTESLNTDSSIALGFFKILYKQRIYSSMRYIVLQAEIGESVVVTEQE